jgi:hypothetical protein
MGLRRFSAALAAAAALSGAAAAEPASADPSFRALGAPAGRVSEIAGFEAGGAVFSIAARGRAAAIDSTETLENLQDCRAMRGLLPGYPQPAHVTFDLRIWF